MNAIDFQELLRLEKQKWRRNRNANKNNGNTTRCSTNSRISMPCCSDGTTSNSSTTATTATTRNSTMRTRNTTQQQQQELQETTVNITLTKTIRNIIDGGEDIGRPFGKSNNPTNNTTATGGTSGGGGGEEEEEDHDGPGSNGTVDKAGTNNDENDNVLLSFSSSLPMCSTLQMQSQTQLDEGSILEQHRVLLMMHSSFSGASSSSSSSLSSSSLVATISDVYYMPEFLTPEFTKLLLDNLDESLLACCCSPLDCSSRSNGGISTDDGNNQSQPQRQRQRQRQRQLRQPQPQQQQQQHPRNGTWTRLYYSQRNVAVFDLTQKPSCCDVDHHNPRLPDVSLRLYVFLQTLAKALVEIKAFPETHPPNHVLINEYDASGGIMPHTDGPMYLDRTATFSIGGGDVLFCLDKNHHYQKKEEEEEEKEKDKMAMATTKEPSQCLLQPPEHTLVQAMQIKLHGTGSLIVFAKDAYTHYHHSIRDRVQDGIEYANENCVNARVGEKVQRGRRISLTFRHQQKNSSLY